MRSFRFLLFIQSDLPLFVFFSYCSEVVDVFDVHFKIQVRQSNGNIHKLIIEDVRTSTICGQFSLMEMNHICHNFIKEMAVM